MERREQDGAIYITLTRDEVRRLTTSVCEIIEPPGEGKMIVVDRLPVPIFLECGDVEIGPIIYHVEETP